MATITQVIAAQQLSAKPSLDKPSLDKPSLDKPSPDKQSLLEVFRTLDGASCPYQYNFHLHTHCSDGQLTPIDLIQQAVHHQLFGLAITDHHSIDGYLEASQWLEQHSRLEKSGPEQHGFMNPGSENSDTDAGQPQLWPGTEITASLLGVDVHILGFAFSPSHGALEPYLQGKAVQGRGRQSEQVIAAIHEAGGFAVLAHPARYSKDLETLIQAAAEQEIDGVEAYYCYSNPDVWEPTADKTQRVEIMAEQFQLLKTAGTDTHGRNILRRI